MKYLPYERLTFESNLTEEQIKQRLLDVVAVKEQHKFFTITRYNTNSKTYEGSVDEQGFSIRRIIRQRNSFLPWVDGKFLQTPGKIYIEVEMQLGKRIRTFGIIWCLIVGIGGTWELLKVNAQKPGMPAYIALLMVVFMYFIALVSFKSECKRSTKDLEALFETKAIPA